LATSNISHVKIFNNDLLITVEGKIYIVNQSNFDIESVKREYLTQINKITSYAASDES